jgi:hypothetical protein
MKDTLRALNTTFAATEVPLPLPDELCAAIESFLERYEGIEDPDSQRFHEDLHVLYLRHVAEDPSKHGAFLSALRLLRPALTGETRLTVWWDLVLMPTINAIGHKRHAIDDAREIVQSILVYDTDEDHDGERARLTDIFTHKLLDAYMARTNVPSSDDNAVCPENNALSHELEQVLVTFGRKMPKVLLSALDELFVQKDYRLQTLNLLSAFVRLQPPHLHLVLETPLIQHLEKCLLVDTSSTIIELALVVLIMFLPHICGALASDHSVLAKLFLVYSRILCWDKLDQLENSSLTDEYADDEEYESGEEAEDENSEQSWEQVQHLDGEEHSSPTLMHYFTFLYGLFPLNFMSFIRKPRKFLKSLNFPGARDFDLDQRLIHRRTEPYRRVHLLHPNMFTTTIEDELSNNRWLKSDPADVVTDCMDLCIAASATLHDSKPTPTSSLPPMPSLAEVPVDFVLDDGGANRNHAVASVNNEHSTTFAPSADASDLPDTSALSPKAKSITSIKSDSPLLKGHDTIDGPSSPTAEGINKESNLNPFTPNPDGLTSRSINLDVPIRSMAGSMPSAQVDIQTQSIASLQREVVLLQNDLNFERYLKLQHLSHIGQLQRKHIKEATAEADTQNLINTNKTLKAKLVKANELYAQLKKETLTSRSQSKKWETDLSAKVRSYRESEKNWFSEEDKLRCELKKTQSDYEHLKSIVEQAEAERLKAQQREEALGNELKDYENVREELAATQQKIIAYEDRTKDLHALFQERINLRNDLEVANMRLNSREVERERSVQAYERRIMDLEQRLHVSEKAASALGQVPPSVQQMFDSALAASTAKLQSMKKSHHRLVEQHTELQMKYQDLEAEHQAALGQFQFQRKSLDSEFESPRLSRTLSLQPANSTKSRASHPLSAEVSLSDDRGYFPDYSSSLISSPSSVIPVSIESPPPLRPQRSQPGPSIYPAFGGGLHPDYSAFPSPRPTSSTPAPQSSGKSSLSVDTESASSRDKVDPKSDLRIYGRGK